MIYSELASYSYIGVQKEYIFLAQGGKSGKIKVVNFLDTLGPHFYYQAIMMRESKFNEVSYSHQLKKKAIYPTMINITHFYAYYKAYNALKASFSDNIDLL